MLAGQFDHVIVGGGSAGCVLAHRLSADRAVRVALIEAGPDTPPGAVPEAIRDSYPMPVFHGDTWIWPDLQARARPDAAPRVYEQGRVMGGSSSINVQAANRGLPRDYDEWAALGAAGWSWQEVLPFFRLLERDLDYPQDPLHGASGPTPIRRIQPLDWPPFCHAFSKGLAAAGLPALQDQNAQFGDGYFPSSFSNENDCRATSASAYLDERTRRRPNLSIHAGLQAEALLFEGLRARAVQAVDRKTGARLRFDAGQIILSAGALQSPALLLRAGIGDADALAAQGIASLHHLPGVGRNLQDHPALSFCHFLAPALRMPLSRRRATMLAARMSSGTGAAEAGDLYLSSAARAAWHELGNRLGLFFLWCNRPHSRGRVQLQSADPFVAPRVDLNLLDDPRDLQSLAAGVRKTVQIVRASGIDGGLDPAMRDFFPAAFSLRVKALSRVGRGNAWLTSLLGHALDLPAPVRRALVDRFLTGGQRLPQLLQSDEALHGFIRRSAFGVWHASGTCRMGPARDPQAVTDGEGRVHGLQGLRVVDASLMPRLPAANTNIPTLMLAEKIAASMVREPNHSYPLETTT